MTCIKNQDDHGIGYILKMFPQVNTATCISQSVKTNSQHLIFSHAGSNSSHPSYRLQHYTSNQSSFLYYIEEQIDCMPSTWYQLSNHTERPSPGKSRPSMRPYLNPINLPSLWIYSYIHELASCTYLHGHPAKPTSIL